VSRRLLARARFRLTAGRAPYAHVALSFAQEGEDLILRRYFEGRGPGTYVDVGAHHPWRFSNTYWFYVQGWSGLNIDATPGSMDAFRRARPRDRNVEAAVAGGARTLTFFAFDDAALNTFDPAAVERAEAAGHRVVEKRELRTTTLAELLREHLPGAKIDFLSVDVEGFDADVLQSNDWDAYAPEIVLAETLGQSVAEVQASPISLLLADRGYELIAKTANTAIYRRPEAP
jgi:FkbM family methyltransferase